MRYSSPFEKSLNRSSKNKEFYDEDYFAEDEPTPAWSKNNQYLTYNSTLPSKMSSEGSGVKQDLTPMSKHYLGNQTLTTTYESGTRAHPNVTNLKATSRNTTFSTPRATSRVKTQPNLFTSSEKHPLEGRTIATPRTSKIRNLLHEKKRQSGSSPKPPKTSISANKQHLNLFTNDLRERMGEKSIYTQKKDLGRLNAVVTRDDGSFVDYNAVGGKYYSPYKNDMAQEEVLYSPGSGQKQSQINSKQIQSQIANLAATAEKSANRLNDLLRESLKFGNFEDTDER